MPGTEKLNPSSSSKSHLKGSVAWQEALEAHPLVEESVVQSPRILRSLSSLGTGESSSPSHRGREWPRSFVALTMPGRSDFCEVSGSLSSWRSRS